VTVAEYAFAVRAGGVPEPKPFRRITWADQLSTIDHPVISISWLDAVSYSLWLSDLTGVAWCLPTEAEWEKAARGTDGRVYPWGNKWDPDCANTPDGGALGATPIDAYPSGRSPYGVWDMVGNVWEWCTSIYRAYPYDATDGREDLTLMRDRVMRGGAWYCTPLNARTTCRGIGYAGMYLGGGFRLVRYDA
jgi:formylglycine-generating enzyme required for sulfatase activity